MTGAGARGVAVGVSGGVDSAVVAALAKEAFPDECIGVWMPCHSMPQDANDAAKVAQAIGIPLITAELDEVWDLLRLAYDRRLVRYGAFRLRPEALRLADVNVKPRLRITALHHIARAKGYLVVGAYQP